MARKRAVKLFFVLGVARDKNIKLTFYLQWSYQLYFIGVARSELGTWEGQKIQLIQLKNDKKEGPHLSLRNRLISKYGDHTILFLFTRAKILTDLTGYH